jgi:hypothetical protein
MAGNGIFEKTQIPHLRRKRSKNRDLELLKNSFFVFFAMFPSAANEQR